MFGFTGCPRRLVHFYTSSDLLLCVQEVLTRPFCIVSYYIKRVTTSWTHSISNGQDIEFDGLELAQPIESIFAL